MEPTFDIFECLADGSRLWRGGVCGLAAALKRAEELAKDSANEMRVIHAPTQTVLGTWPAKWSKGSAAAQISP